MDEEAYRQRILEEQLSAQTAIDQRQKDVHLGLMHLYEEELLARRREASRRIC